uniref:Reverse transcriptase domain-containing protein n=1 Tax=Tanacetum cinerariifolium TaxID=118510 RepID=A0A699J4R3_TANCI|nr:hypothetical protein [Tanacetum cinerariifolium]
MPEDPYAYVEAAMQEPPLPDFILKHVYPEFMPPEDDVVPAEEQPLYVVVSPTADSQEDEGEDEEEKEEHLALADSVPPPAYRTPPLLPILLPTSSPPLLLPSTDCRADVYKVTLPPQKRLCIALELSQRMKDFVTTVRQDTYEIYGRLDDAQDDRLLMSGQLNSLCRDRRSHARTTRLMESEARASLEA